MQIGKLDRRVTITGYTYTKLPTGEDLKVAGVPNTVWASVEDVGQDEKYEADQKVYPRVSKFVIRNYVTIDTTYTITYDGLVYDILQIQEIGRSNRLEIKGKARDNG